MLEVLNGLKIKKNLKKVIPLKTNKGEKDYIGKMKKYAELTLTDLFDEDDAEDEC